MSLSKQAFAISSIAVCLIAVSVGLATAGELPIAKAPSPAQGHSASPADAGVVTLIPRLELPGGLDDGHMLYPVVRKVWAGEFGQQPEWRLSLLLTGLQNEPRKAKVTAYSSRCPDGGGPRTRWGTRVRRGICAADPRYWGPGSVIWMDEPINSVLIVEDTGSAIKGRDRFDVSFATDAAACRRFGVRRLTYVPLYVAAPTRRWGTKPANWAPPASAVHQVLRTVLPVEAVPGVPQEGAHQVG